MLSKLALLDNGEISNLAFPRLTSISDDAVLALLDKSAGHYMIGARDVITPSQANLLNHWILMNGDDRTVTINLSPDDWLNSTTVCDVDDLNHVFCSDLEAEEAMADLTFVLYALEWL